MNPQLNVVSFFCVCPTPNLLFSIVDLMYSSTVFDGNLKYLTFFYKCLNMLVVEKFSKVLENIFQISDLKEIWRASHARVLIVLEYCFRRNSHVLDIFFLNPSKHSYLKFFLKYSKIRVLVLKNVVLVRSLVTVNVGPGRGWSDHKGIVGKNSHLFSFMLSAQCLLMSQPSGQSRGVSWFQL